MTDVRPTDLPEMRAELVLFLAGLDPEAIKAAARNMGGDVPGEWLRFHYQRSQNEAASLAQAALYHVSPEMAALAVVAGATLPPFTLEPEDVPSPCGLIYFGTPLRMDTQPNEEPTWAASWRPDGDGLHIDWYVSSETYRMNVPSDQAELSEAFRTGPRLVSLTNTQAPYRRHGEYGESNAGVPYNDVRASWLNSLKAMWLLMQQPLARVSEVQPDRPTRKRLRRIGHKAASVRVIELRRPKGSGEQGDGGRDYHHQWIVRGHWRQQWYPAREVHRPVWIAPHVKGPEGAPLIGGEKVYAWKR